MSKLLHISPSKCIGCRTCEMACAFSHPADGKPGMSRIRIFPDPENRPSFSKVVVCLQCEEAACVTACPANALWRNPKTGAIYHVEDRCIRCRSCVIACPFGNMHWDPAPDLPIKCDLCGGDPACAKFCPSGALIYE
jgi:anaerobic carbon-monoxide dehydrogenase iron sulfur subunit